MWKMFTVNGNQKRVNILNTVVDQYNIKVHSTIGVTPTEASNDPWKIQKHHKDNIFINERTLRNGKPKFKIGDHVRIFKWKVTLKTVIQ